ncbi:MAG TPA: nitrate reductase molybdenum cofactor assembly chaperone, partial [Hyphomicrobiaceae bacterium]|nr:nitrate reductase molybdenum cofactor assembly chaperone [Hyphomicrobiaceae bacterium]
TGDKALPQKSLDALGRLLGEFETTDLFDLQERYILLFDRTRSLSLHLFEHVHGESRDRGQAMVDLQQLYEQHGLAFVSTELPDFLPLFLEFVSTIPDDEARDLLSEPAHIFEAMRLRLKKRKSPYEAVFWCLQHVAKGKPNPDAVKAMLDAPDPDANDLVALDAAWEEEEVRFGPSASECGHENLASKMRAGMRPAPGVTAPPRQHTIVTHSPSNRA